MLTLLGAVYAEQRPKPPAGVHPTAVVSSDASLGEDVSVGPRVVVEAGAVIGDRTQLQAGSYLGHGFHEDGIASGLAVAEQLGGIARPWAGDPDFDQRRAGFEEYLQVAE